MAILLDTQVLVWIALDPSRLTAAARGAIEDGGAVLLVSAVTACEFADLNRRGRFGADLPLDAITDRLAARVLDFPAACWRLAAELPAIHRDPVDRMLIAHALQAGLTLVTADEMMRRYPVPCLW